MLPDEFIFKVDITDVLYHCVRRPDRTFSLRHNNQPDDPEAIWDEHEILRFIGNGWTIVHICAEDEEINVDIQNLI